MLVGIVGPTGQEQVVGSVEIDTVASRVRAQGPGGGEQRTDGLGVLRRGLSRRRILLGRGGDRGRRQGHGLAAGALHRPLAGSDSGPGPGTGRLGRLGRLGCLGRLGRLGCLGCLGCLGRLGCLGCLGRLGRMGCPGRRPVITGQARLIADDGGAGRKIPGQGLAGDEDGQAQTKTQQVRQGRARTKSKERRREILHVRRSQKGCPGRSRPPAPPARRGCQP